jgi:hypothetical protein
MTRSKLTLSCPRAVAEQVIEHLLESSLVSEGFTTIAGSGHGADFRTASLSERVRGRVDVTLVIAILPAADIPSLLEELGSKFRGAHIRYWTEPVHASGDLA